MTDHPLAGHFSVEESARRVRSYRYVEERLMRMMGGWIALTPELPAKLLLGRHVWECAQHADLWGKRLPELREPAQRSEPANARVVHLMDALEAPEAPGQTLERLTGVYRVLKPHLVAVYDHHLRTANTVYEPPTCRILSRCVAEERRHAAAGAIVLRHLANGGADDSRIADREQRLRMLLTEAGGVTGDAGALVTSAPDEAGPAPEQDVVILDPVFDVRRIEPDVAALLHRHGNAIAAADWNRAEVDIAPDARHDVVAEYRRLDAPWDRVELVAVAKIGGLRAAKLRFSRDGRSAVLQVRCGLAGDDWRVVAAEIIQTAPLS